MFKTQTLFNPVLIDSCTAQIIIAIFKYTKVFKVMQQHTLIYTTKTTADCQLQRVWVHVCEVIHP